MISLTNKRGNINLATNNSEVEVKAQGENSINLSADDANINLQIDSDELKLNIANYYKGDKGEPGEDGFSPIVDVEEIDGGHRVSITDATGTDTFNIMDGKDGDSAAAAPANWSENNPSAPGYIKNRTHYYTEPFTLSWDGEKSDREVIVEGDDVCFTKYHKIGDIPDKNLIYKLTPSDVTMVYHFIDSTYIGNLRELGIVKDNFRITEGKGYIMLNEYIIFTYEPDAAIQFHANSDLIVFPNTGVYVYDYADIDLEERTYIRDINFSQGVKKLDIEFIPDEALNHQTLTSGDNAIIEDNQINVFTNTGYKISDKDVKAQAITSTGYRNKKIIYAKNISTTFIIDGSNILRVSKNNIDFEIVELSRNIDDIIYIPYNGVLIILSSAAGCLLISSDGGKTWVEHYSEDWKGYNYLFTYKEKAAYFNMVRKSEREIRTYYFIDEDYTPRTSNYYRRDSYHFMARFNDNTYISCDEAGAFEYCNERYFYDTFADLPAGCIVNTLVSNGNTPIVGLKNSNKIYQLRYTGNTSTSKWIEYTLPQICTVNDVIYYENTKDYYILTDINTYYKTKDFINYESIDKGVRGIQGCVTLMGLQAITNNSGELLLAPARTRLEDKAQEWDRATNKELWVGDGLKHNKETGVVSVRVQAPLQVNPSTGIIRLNTLSMEYMPTELQETIMLAAAPIYTGIIANYGDMDTWYWDEGYPLEDIGIAKVIFDEDTTFWDFFNYEEEYTVEKYEYGYIYTDGYEGISYYKKLGNLAGLFN